MSKPKMFHHEVALDAVKMHQEAFWEALTELETVSGRSLSSVKDYADADVHDILRGDYDEE